MSDNKYRIKNLTIGNVLGEGFNLFFKNIKKMSAPAFFYSLITIVVIFGTLIAVFMNFTQLFEDIENIGYMNGNLEDILRMMAIILPLYGFIIIVSIIMSTLLGLVATTRSSELYLKKETTPILQVIKNEKGRFFPFLGLTLLLGLIISTGMTFFIVPGIILSLALYITIPIFILEKKSVTNSLQRSWNLTKGRKTEIFVIQFVTSFLIQAIASALLIIPVFVVSIAFAGMAMVFEEMVNGPEGIMTLYSIMIFLLMGPTILLTIVTTSLNYGFTTSIYYNILKDTEGFATEHLSKSFLTENKNQ